MQKLTNKAVGTLRVHDVSLNLLKANDYIAERIREDMKAKNDSNVKRTIANDSDYK